jgi:hypothetical protein
MIESDIERLPTIMRRFQRKIHKPCGESGCWLWMGNRDQRGAGLVCLIGRRRMRATRLSYLLVYGEILEGYSVLQTCHNLLCVNPAHLWATRQQFRGENKL